MSSIHYKFKATLEYKTLVFDGLHISITDLKKEICEKENIKAESFDLVLTNAHTKRQYTGDELIPRNSSVIVQRIPRDNAAKLPKVQDTTNSGIVTKSTPTEAPVVGHIDSEEFDKMTEEERLAHVKEVSTYKYLPSNFQKKTSSIMSGPPPPTYVCNRCSQSGHWYKNCPMLNTRRTTGITMDELMETTSDDPLAMLHPSGKYVVPIMHWKARQKKPEIAKPEPEIREIPPELKCPICSQLLRDAVLTTCCGDSFCADCLQQRLLETPNAKCPGTNCFQTAVSTDKLVPNLKMRQAAEAFKHGAIHNTAFESTNSSPRIDEQPVQPPVSRVRIGLSGRPQQVQPAIVIHHQQQQQQQQSHQQQQQQQQQETAVTSPQSQIRTSSPTYVIQPSTNVTIPAALQSQMIIKQFSGNNVMPSPGVTPAQSQPKVIAPTVVVPNVQQLAVAPPPLPLPVNVHQPPPGYPTILPSTQLMHVATSSSSESIASGTHTARSISAAHLTVPPLLLPPGVQPPPPGLSAVIFPRVPAPPPVKDAWDEYLERKDKESRQRAAAPPLRRRRRSTRSTSYSSSSTSSESSSGSSRSRSRSSSRGRNRSHRDKRRNDGREKHSSRRRDSRSPFRSSYASTRYHRDNLASSFNLYQHTSGAAAIGLPGASLIHHRIPSLLNSYCPPQYALNQTSQATSYSSFSNGPVPNYRSSRTYLEERNRRHSPRSVQNRRRNESRERENDRKERTEERRRGRDGDERTRRDDRERRAKEDSDREERRQKKDKYKRRQEKETKEIENAAEGRHESTFKIEEGKDVGAVDLKEIVVDGEAKRETTPHIENKGTENDIGDVENNVEKENDTVDEALPDGVAAENGVAGFRSNHDDGSGAEAENENEGLDNEKETGNITTGVLVENKDKSEKKRHRKKKRKHRRHEEDKPEDDETGRKKHKKHKRSKEEKEQRKQEKEKRREERRRRRQERETEQVSAVESAANKGSEYEMSSVTGIVDKDHENEITDNKITHEVKKAAMLKSVELMDSGTLEQKSEEKAIVESKPRDDQEGCGSGKKADEKEGRSGDSSSLPKGNDKKNVREHLKHEKDRRRKHDLSRKREESKDDSRITRKRNDERETKRSEEKDSRKQGDKFRKNDRKDEKLENKRWDNREGKTKGGEREPKRSGNAEKPESEMKKESRHKEHGEKRKNDTGRSDHKRPRLRSHGSHDEQRNASNKSDQKILSEISDIKKVVEVDEIGPVVRNETDPLLLSKKKSGLNSRVASKIVDSVDGTKVHESTDQKVLDEIKVSVEKEIERKVEALPTSSNYNMPNLTVELKSGGEKRVTRENIFEGATPYFNARQKIKMILLSESERKAADRSSKKRSGVK
ncbi:Zinc knuckle family protein [Brugia malayi]|uniref:BMA-TAG-214 n=2 Tax=Brugia malayi TaxID=6279 RepID=A0A0J9Y428_BRUMA|nr:Zinc knuckle family protein [Brugia malayi]CDQ01718.1 BMA-TAG-214 [Brugia malayi]VIO95169.1 Zinc knuckle family protein [Brugia malayi]